MESKDFKRAVSSPYPGADETELTHTSYTSVRYVLISLSHFARRS
jgi:hypothetical protein